MVPSSTRPGGNPVTARPGADPEVAGDRARAGVGDRAAGQDGERGRGPQTDGGLRRDSGDRRRRQQEGEREPTGREDQRREQQDRRCGRTGGLQPDAGAGPTRGDSASQGAGSSRPTPSCPFPGHFGEHRSRAAPRDSPVASRQRSAPRWLPSPRPGVLVERLARLVMRHRLVVSLFWLVTFVARRGRGRPAERPADLRLLPARPARRRAPRSSWSRATARAPSTPTSRSSRCPEGQTVTGSAEPSRASSSAVAQRSRACWSSTSRPPATRRFVTDDGRTTFALVQGPPPAGFGPGHRGRARAGPGPGGRRRPGSRAA